MPPAPCGMSGSGFVHIGSSVFASYAVTWLTPRASVLNFPRFTATYTTPSL